MKKLNKTHYAILGMLSIAPMSGYDIRQTMQKSTANFWSESDGQLYPALRQLTTHKVIICKVDSSSAREKKIYQITANGLTALKKWLAEKPETFSVRNELMLKLFFGTNVSPDISLEHIQAHRYQTKMMIDQLTETKKQLVNEHESSPHFPYWQMSIHYGIKLAEAKLQWCDEAIQDLLKIKRGIKS